MLMMICLTISVGAVRSIRRLWMRISYRSQVLEPSPQGVLRVCPSQISVSPCPAVMRKTSTYHDLEGLGGQADGALGAEVLVLGALDELLADLLEGLHLAGGQGDACGRSSVRAVLTGVRKFGPRTDLVDLGGLAKLLLGLVVRHLDGLISGCPSRLERGGRLRRVSDCHVVVPYA